MMSTRNPRVLWVVPLVGFLLLAALPAEAGPAETAKPVVRMSIHGGNASFAPLVNADGMTLRVAGRGHVSEQRVDAGQTMSFAPVDKEGFVLPDGTYKWEVTAAPRLDRRSMIVLEKGRMSTDGRSVMTSQAPRGERQSGVFTIKNGIMVDPALIEVQSARAPVSAAPQAASPPTAAERAAEHTDRDQ